MCGVVPTDVTMVAQKLQMHDKASHQPQYYEAKVRDEKNWNFAVRRVRHDGKTISSAIGAVYKNFEREKGWVREEKKGIKKAGTQKIFDQIKACAEKGCISDPLRVDEMYRQIGQTSRLGLPIYKFKGGSGKNESLHGALNAWFKGISLINETKMQRSIDLWLHDFMGLWWQPLHSPWC